MCGSGLRDEQPPVVCALPCGCRPFVDLAKGAVSLGKVEESRLSMETQIF